MTEVIGHRRYRKRGVPIYFDPDQVEEINRWRTTQPGKPSFSEAVRTLVEFGLEGSNA